jgi:carotenoid cleavage oxygenase
MDTSTSMTTAASTSAAAAFLTGNFAPVGREVTLADLPVRGALPRELSGVLMRNGPNPIAPHPEKHHWFAGDGMLHGLELRDGRALGYRNRYVRTERVERELGLPAAPVSPYAPFYQGSGSVNVVRHGGRILALGEAGLPYEMGRDLATERQYDYEGALRSSMTAHPKLDPVTGEQFFFGYDVGEVPLRYHVAAPDGRLTRSVDISLPEIVMIHDFAVTETRVVFMDLPVVFDLALVEQGYAMPFRWDDRHTARVGVMRRDGDGSDLRWFEIPPCYVYHLYNAYDDGERIVMDLVEHPRTFAESLTGPEDDGTPRCTRYELDPASCALSRTVLDERGEEFPRIDPRRACRPHRYGYAVQTRWAGGVGFEGLVKHDFARGTAEVHEVGPGRAASEGVFVPVGSGEDEGYVLAPVYDAARDASEVIVIDAQRFSNAPVAVIELPVRIPFGFHGDFFADA